eukprot:5850069-Pyramimonas_sp.AAC.2
MSKCNMLRMRAALCISNTGAADSPACHPRLWSSTSTQPRLLKEYDPEYLANKFRWGNSHLLPQLQHSIFA